uniref:Uncharacterized protein n=1 Tax=Plectus sambesii TaxID=2011161 RepID=A0A914XJ43_9BILA
MECHHRILSPRTIARSRRTRSFRIADDPPPSRLVDQRTKPQFACVDIAVRLRVQQALAQWRAADRSNSTTGSRSGGQRERAGSLAGRRVVQPNRSLLISRRGRRRVAQSHRIRLTRSRAPRSIATARCAQPQAAPAEAQGPPGIII